MALVAKRPGTAGPAFYRPGVRCPACARSIGPSGVCRFCHPELAAQVATPAEKLEPVVTIPARIPKPSPRRAGDVLEHDDDQLASVDPPTRPAGTCGTCGGRLNPGNGRCARCRDPKPSPSPVVAEARPELVPMVEPAEALEGDQLVAETLKGDPVDRADGEALEPAIAAAEALEGDQGAADELAWLEFVAAAPEGDPLIAEAVAVPAGPTARPRRSQPRCKTCGRELHPKNGRCYQCRPGAGPWLRPTPADPPAGPGTVDDPELAAIAAAFVALRGLDGPARLRAFDYLGARLLDPTTLPGLSERRS